jgi:NADH dehydrogenase
MTVSSGLVAVTGAFSYTGRPVGEQLLRDGHPVRTLVRTLPAADRLRNRIDARVVSFDDEDALARELRGAETLINTTWIRYEHSSATFATAIANGERLFRAARRAGISRIVHVSVASADPTSPIPYYRAKGLLEERLGTSGVPHSIVRPTLLFGPNDVLVNNMAWFLRRSPVFGLFGRGRYRIQPVHVDDVARLCIALARKDESVTVDAAGPERFEFRAMVRLVADAVGSRALLVPMPALASLTVSRMAGLVLGDVVLTSDEVAALRGELLVSGRVTGTIDFRQWITAHGAELGRTWTNDLERHYGRRATATPPPSVA